MNNYEDVDYDESMRVGESHVLSCLEESIADDIRIWAKLNQVGVSDAESLVRLFWRDLLDQTGDCVVATNLAMPELALAGRSDPLLKHSGSNSTNSISTTVAQRHCDISVVILQS
jgi:hypothetical protein